MERRKTILNLKQNKQQQRDASIKRKVSGGNEAVYEPMAESVC